MMDGGLYRFGTGWFFNEIPFIVLAPVDILIILLSGGLTWPILAAARKRERWPGKGTAIAIAALCVAVAAIGPAIAMATPKNSADVFGCYVFDENVYTNPVSSYRAFGELPYIYGFDENELVIATTGAGGIQRFTDEYFNTPVGTDEFLAGTGFPPGSSIFAPPDLSQFKERFLLAVMRDGDGAKYGLYRMDNEVWLVELRGSWIWSIYRLAKTDVVSLADLERAKKHYVENPPVTLPSGFHENQMTLKDVFALARKGEALTLQDFEPFFYWLDGPGFAGRRYEVVGADTVFVRVEGDELESAQLWSRRTLDRSQVVDLREGFEAVASYMDPLRSFADVAIEDARAGGSDLAVGGDMAGGNGLAAGEGRELIYDYDYDQCRYYLRTKRAASVTIVFSSGERMPLKQALEERRVTVEEAYANGLGPVFMIPIDNPLGGEFTVMRHQFTFTLNGETFYPSKSFMYAVWNRDGGDGGNSLYFDLDEVAQLLEWYGHNDDAKALRLSAATAEITDIARGRYIRDTALSFAGIETHIGQGFGFAQAGMPASIQLSIP
jgi:hypothetical protein